MNQNPSKAPSNSANSNFLAGSYKFPLKTPKEKEKFDPYNMKLPPISTMSGSNPHHQIIFGKPKFPHSSVHVNQSFNKNLQTQTFTKNDLELNEEDLNGSNYSKKPKMQMQVSTASNINGLKNLQFQSGSLHLATNNLKNQESDIKEIKNSLGVETNNDMNSYNKIVKDLENIIEQSHYPKSLKNGKNNFFEMNHNTKNYNDSRAYHFSPKKSITPNSMLKTPSKILSPLKLKGTTLNFDANIATSLLFSPNQRLNPEYLPMLESSKSSSKKNGIVKAYAANTHQGLVRNYNEDRVAIILNIMKPPNKKDISWPLCSYFAIYDGHGGTKCAEFLRDNLHHYVVKDQNFPANPKLAIKKGFQLAERNFLDYAQNKNGGILEKSGSCAIVVLIIDDMCYVANVGDSRAVLSQEKGNKIFPLSKDHKPDQEEEKQRILEAGGQVYQSQAQTMQIQGNSGSMAKTIQGPYRVLPGRLSVSRTFGDAEAKLKAYGGNPNVVIAEADIKSFKITEEHDFIILGCDGIFDRLNNKDAIKAIWETVTIHKFKTIHEFSGKAIENLMRESLMNKTLDNITSVMISFKNLKDTLFVKKNNMNNKEVIPANVDKNGNLIIDKFDLIEYNYSPDNPNEATLDEPLQKIETKNDKQTRAFSKNK